MRLTRLIFSLLAAAALLGAADNPTFEGKWVMVAAQSNFGGETPPQGMSVEATLQNGEINANIISHTARGDVFDSLNWYLDGKPHPTNKSEPGITITHWDGNTLVNTTETNNKLMKSITRLTVSPDRKTATELITIKTPNGVNREKMVWQRVQ